MRFASPWIFLALAVVPLVLFYLSKRGRRASMHFSSLGNARAAGGSVRQRFAALPLILRVIAIVLVIVALARPQMGRERVKDVTKGIAIEMVLDRSGSMGAEMEYKGGRLNRLEVVKHVFEEFVIGNGATLDGRPNDLIGMVAFARYADTMAPLTLGHGALVRFLDGIDIVKRRSEDGTSIGDALALAAARLNTAEEDIAKYTASGEEKEYNIKSKIIILLTDGQNNYGQRTPLGAAELAARWGIKVYTIGVGSAEGVRTVRTLLGNFKMPTGGGVDTKTLGAIAERTGGIFRVAEDEESLRHVYAEIDELERSEIESVRYIDYRELFVPFAAAAMIVLILEVVLVSTVLRRIP